MVIKNDLEWPMLSYYVIYYEKFRKVMQWTENVALNYVQNLLTIGKKCPFRWVEHPLYLLW